MPELSEPEKYLALPEARPVQRQTKSPYRSYAIVFIWRLLYSFKPLREVNANTVANAVQLYDRYTLTRTMLDPYHAQLTASVAICLSAQIIQDVDVVDLCLLDRKGLIETDMRVFSDILADMVTLANHELSFCTVAGWIALYQSNDKGLTRLAFFVSECMLLLTINEELSIEQGGKLCLKAVRVLNGEVTGAVESDGIVEQLVALVRDRCKAADPESFLCRRYRKLLGDGESCKWWW